MNKSSLSLSLLVAISVSANAQVAPSAPEVRFPSPNLPPLQGVYVTPAQFHAAYANGIIISNISHRRFTQSTPPPPTNGTQVHNFGSIVEFDRVQAGVPIAHAVADAGVSVRVTHVGSQGMMQIYDTEMLSLNITGGGLPVGAMIRESPTLQSRGRTTVRPAADGNGYMISSFFDIFTELSLNGGQTWSPAPQPAHVELRNDPTTVPPIIAPSSLLPPRNDLYITPAQFHLLFSNGIVIRDIRHSLFTRSIPPPPPGQTVGHLFDSQLDFQLSTDGGRTFRHGRAPAATATSLRLRSMEGPSQVFDTEMLSLSLQGGDLPPGLRLRESPTRPSMGGTAVQRLPDGTFQIQSFFDVFTEVSLDNGANWTPAVEPARVELISDAPEHPFPSPNLPPPGQYVSPQRYHALYAQGIILSNISHRRFTQSQPPPPPPNGSQTHELGSEIEADLSQDGGQSWRRILVPATMTALVRSAVDADGTRYFDTEMLALNLAGGGLPTGIRVRESPTRASLGRTSIRQVPGGGTIWDYISSFFDVFTELSLDNGQTWLPTTTGPGHVVLDDLPINPPITILCPLDRTATATSAAGAVVNYPPPLGSGGCDPTPTIVCVPPSGSTFPIGSTTVTCTASDSCGSPRAICQFKVTVRRGFIEVDKMDYGLAEITLQLPSGGTETVRLSGPTTVHVFFDGEMEGDADDSDGDGLDDVDTEMVSLELTGMSSLGPVRATLRPGTTSRGQIEELANGTPGTMDIEPFVPGAAGANSFFDVFTEISLGDLVLHPAQAIRMQGVIKHKPPGPGDTYVNPFTQPVELLNANGQPTGIRIIREVHTPNPEQERDSFTYTQGKINIRHPNGQIERVIVAGPTEVLVNIPPNGAAADSDGDGLDQVPMEMVSMNLAGNSSQGPVMVMLDSARCRTLGEIEETANATPGVLDVPPFTAAGTANSRFDLCIKIVVNGRVLRPCNNALVRISSVISHKPPRPGEPYMNLINQEVPLCDENGQPTGIILTGEMHTPNPPKEIDFFPDTVAQLTVRVGGAEEVVTVRGPTRVEVSIDDNPASPGYGLAADTDADGRDEVPTQMTLLQLTGNSSLGPVQVSLRADRPSFGEIEETANLTAGVLDVPPFGPAGSTADSFFNIWTRITVGGQTYTTAQPLHMAARIRHKPPAPGDEYVNPFLQPVELLDAAGRPTGIFIVREVHTPNPDCVVAITCPPDMKVGATVAAGVVVNYPPPVVAATCPPVTVVCVPPSGSVFPIGTTTVTCTATDRIGKTATCQFRVTVFRRFVEIDRMDYGLADVTLQLPSGGTETVRLAGPTTVHVFFDGEEEGDADDSDGDGLEDVDTEMVSMNLVGGSSFGPVRATLRPGTRSRGQIEESANGNPGTLNVPPFAPGTANSYFDVDVELQVGELVLHPAQPIRMQGVIKHKPPGPGDTYVNPFTQPVPLLDANGNDTGIRIIREVHTPNPEQERDSFTYTQGKINIRHPNGQIERVIVAGPTEVLVDIPPNGAAADTDGDGLDQVPMEMVSMNLVGNSSLGPVMVMLDSTRCRTLGEIEETVNATPGVLDVPPFTAAGTANSRFDLCLKIVVNGRVFRPCNNALVRIASVISHKPPRPGEAYMNLINQEVPLCDENGQPTGIILTGEMHTPNPPKEIDFFPNTVAQLTVRVGTAEEVVTVRGPTRVEVSIDDNPASPGYGLAADTDADGRDEVPTEMTLLNLTGNSSLGPVQVSLRADRPSLGEIEETVNLTAGVLDVPPFGPPNSTADSFFNLWTRITVGGQTYTTAQPLHMAARIRHKPPAPGDEYINPFLQPVELLDANGRPTGIFIVREVHTPNPDCVIAITCPPDMKVGAIVAAGVVVNYPPPVVVATCPPVTVVCVPPSGSVFPIGTTTVTCTATDRIGKTATCQFRVTVFRRFVEIDRMDYGLADVTLARAGGGTETVRLSGPTTVHVFFDGEEEGNADDSDGDGRDEVDTEMVSLELTGMSSMGPVRARLRPGTTSRGQIEETANSLSGRLDVPPFGPPGSTADSFFDVNVELQVGELVLHPAQPLRMAGIIRHKPPGPGDTYFNPFTQPVPLLDANGNDTGIRIIREVHTPNPEQERDFFTYTQGKINIRHPGGRIERVIVAGPTEVLVNIPPNGAAADTDGDGLDQVPMEMVGLNLVGNSSLGPVMVMLDTNRCRTLGEIEEKVNNTPGTLDIPPFTPVGGANSSFNLCIKIVVNGRVFRPCGGALVHIASMISHKPPGPGEAYMNLINQEVPLCDENGQPTGIILTGEMHTPNPPKEIDFFPDTVAQLTVRVGTAEEVVTVRGPTRVEVSIDDNPASAGYGLAADTDADGRDEVPTQMTLLQLTGNSSLGPVQVNLRTDRPSLGEIEETANLTAGVLDVPPFGPPNSTADSFFNIWTRITVGGQTYTTAQPLHMAARIRHKPPAPGDEYVNPFLQPVELLDAAGNRTGIFIVREVHTPNPGCTNTISCPSNIVTWTCRTNGDVVIYPPPVVVGTCPPITVVCVPPSGSVFPIGTTTTTCTATDRLGNRATCTFTVRLIRDTTPPVITCPSNIVVLTCRERERVGWTVSATDDCDTNVTLRCDPPSGTVFPIGSHVVICRATDDCGNESKCEFRVEVRRIDPLPQLTITRLTDGRLRICWTAACGDWVLQCTRSLNPPILWETITNAPTTSGSQNCIILPKNSRYQFYRLIKRDDPPEVYAETDLLPPQGTYLAPGDEITVILYPTPGAPPRRILARWFVHPIPVPPIVPRPPPCLTCPPQTHEFRTDVDFQVSLDDGESWREVHMVTDVAVVVGFDPQPDPPADGPRSFNTEIIRLDGQPGPIVASGVIPPLVLMRESPTRRSVGKTTIREAASGDGTFRIGSFFDVFIEVSIDGGQFWAPVQSPVHMELNGNAPAVGERTDALPPQGNYDSPQRQITRYANGVLARRFVYPIPPNPRPPIPPIPNPPCLTCPPATYRITTDISFEVSTDGGRTWMPAGAMADGSVRSRLGTDVGGKRYFETELLQLDVRGGGAGLPNIVMIRESPTRPSLGKTKVGTSPSLSMPYRIESFFDVFTELSVDGGQTWSPAADPTHVELLPALLP